MAATAKGKTAEPVRVDVHRGTRYDEAVVWTVCLPHYMGIDGAYSLKRSGGLGDGLPDRATADEKRSYEIASEIKHSEGVDEVRPTGHALEIVFSRVHIPVALMPDLLSRIFTHFGFTHVQLSFWEDGADRVTWVRVPPPFELKVRGVKIEPLPHEPDPQQMSGLHLQVKAGYNIYTVPVAGPLPEELAAVLLHPRVYREDIVVVGVVRSAEVVHPIDAPPAQPARTTRRRSN
jgi:hypothetical protein